MKSQIRSITHHGAEVATTAHFPWFRPHTTNVALHRPYTIGAQWPDRSFHLAEQAQHPDRGNLTSDGEGATLKPGDPGWTGLLRQYGRSVTVDLGAVLHVQDASLRFLQHMRAGIQFPDCVNFYTSEDNVAWQVAGRAFLDSTDWQDTPASRVVSIAMDRHARYVRLQFTAKVYAFIRELRVGGRTARPDAPSPDDGPVLTSIMGDNYLVDPEAPDGDRFTVRAVPRKGQDAAEDPVHADKPGARAGGTPAGRMRAAASEDSLSEGYLTADDPQSGGVNHMQLVYTGPGDGTATWTEDDFLPLVAALDADGEPTAWLFDGALFCPHAKLPHSAAAWTSWLDNLFTQGIQLSALDQTVDRIKRRGVLQDDFTVGVVLTLPVAMKASADFGSFSGGPPLVMDPALVGRERTAENKYAAIAHVLQEGVRRFAALSPRHLRLVGFYWRAESQDVNDPYSPWLIRQTADAIHGEGLRFFWIPFYGAVGVPVARNLGFDAVFIQPGVAFHPEVDAADRLAATARLAEHCHAGIELELHWDILNRANPEKAAAALARYKEYLSAARRHGFDGNVAKAYYLNTKTLSMCSRSADASAREAYTATVSLLVGGQ